MSFEEMNTEVFADKVFITSLNDEQSKLVVSIPYNENNIFSGFPKYIYCPLFLGKKLMVRFQRKAFFDEKVIYEAIDYSEKEPEEECVYFTNTFPKHN